MSEVQAGDGAGEAGSTGGESTELTSEQTGATGADQGGEGSGESGASQSTGAEGGEGGEGSSGAGEGGEGSAAAARTEDTSVNKRFSEVTKQRDEAQKIAREANDNLRRALEALERANGGKKVESTTPTQPVDDIGAEPEPPVFEDPDQYQRDMADYTRKVVERTTKLQLKAAETQRQTKAAEESNRAAQIAHAQAWQARRAKAMEEMSDYADVAENPSLHVSREMMIGITSSEHGPKLAYHLGQHPELAERISKMQPVMQLIELGKLEAQITAPKPPKVSKAPSPIRHQTGSGSPQAKSLDEMSMEEYATHRSKH